MSIETDLKRIADGVDKIVSILSSVTVAQPVTCSKAITAKEIKEMQPVVTAVEPVAEKVAEPTEDEIRIEIKELASKDREKAIELLVKYGAKKEKPMIKDVTDKTGLMKELKG